MKVKDDFYDMITMKWLSEPGCPDELLKSLGITREREEMISGTMTPFAYPEGSNQAEMQDNEVKFYGPAIVSMPSVREAQANKTAGLIKGLEKRMKDVINPSHYKGIIGDLQYIETQEYLLGKEGLRAHLLGQGYKYLMRMGKKDAEIQELKKAIWYFRCLQILLRDGTIIGKLKELE